MANCRYLTRSPDDAQDLTQEVFVKAFFGLSSFAGKAKFRSWLQRIKVNHCLNFLKKKRGKSYVDLDDVTVQGAAEMQVEPTAESRAMAADDRARIRLILDEMPDTLRVPLILRDLDQLSYQEISDELGIGLSATKMRIKRAREEFRARFQTITAAEDAMQPGAPDAGEVARSI